MSSLTSDQLRSIGRLKDLVTGKVGNQDSFLYYLPQLLEQQTLKPTILKSYISFAECALNYQKPTLVDDALKLLNQIVNFEDGSLIKPNPEMFVGNLHFKWQELGNHTDAISAISHIINKTALVLNLGN